MKVDARQLWEALHSEVGELGTFELLPVVEDIQLGTAWDRLPLPTRALLERIARRLRPVD